MAVRIMLYSKAQYFSGVFSNTLSSQGVFSVHSYTEYDKAAAALKSEKHPIQAILADEDFFRNIQVNEPVIKICLSDVTHPADETNNLHYLNIYQRLLS